MKIQAEFVTPEEFASEMSVLLSKGIYPLHRVFIADGTDAMGKYYVPCLQTYVDGSFISSGAHFGYMDRSAAMAFVGHLMDKVC
ncbi:hypothetical protein L2750_14430 [Shewanella submarina]|uniref:Uncharacterized protein n=1 Tax=Shewanella submarina TaxID=2016376 RepID=A0ABV7G830_9GAMM|nr:hypothetical protein [Shewanella submarina]MCL1038327.1 hypothetical protein [Shewanella submarina]